MAAGSPILPGGTRLLGQFAGRGGSVSSRWRRPGQGRGGLSQNVIPWGCLRPSVNDVSSPRPGPVVTLSPCAPRPRRPCFGFSRDGAPGGLKVGLGCLSRSGSFSLLRKGSSHLLPLVLFSGLLTLALCPGCVDGSETGLQQGLGGAFLAEIQVNRSCWVVLGLGGEGGIPSERRERGGWRERGPNGSDAVCSQRPYLCLGWALQEVPSCQGAC